MRELMGQKDKRKETEHKEETEVKKFFHKSSKKK